MTPEECLNQLVFISNYPVEMIRYEEFWEMLQRVAEIKDEFGNPKVFGPDSYRSRKDGKIITIRKNERMVKVMMKFKELKKYYKNYYE